MRFLIFLFLMFSTYKTFGDSIPCQNIFENKQVILSGELAGYYSKFLSAITPITGEAITRLTRTGHTHELETAIASSYEVSPRLFAFERLAYLIRTLAIKYDIKYSVSFLNEIPYFEIKGYSEANRDKLGYSLNILITPDIRAIHERESNSYYLTLKKDLYDNHIMQMTSEEVYEDWYQSLSRDQQEFFYKIRSKGVQNIVAH